MTGNMGRNLVKNILKLMSRKDADNGDDSFAMRDDCVFTSTTGGG
jgi:hypothetical protein